MATQAELDHVNAQSAYYQAQIAELIQQIANLNTLAAGYRQREKEAQRMRHNAEEDAARIEAALAALQQKTEDDYMAHREMVNEKAQSVLARATEMVEELRSETHRQAAAFKQRLDTVRDPATGLRSPFETLFLSLFALHREDALTAEEYGQLDLPAAAYDEAMLQGIDHDLEGKRWLAPYDGPVSALSATEYDAMQLTAQAYAAAMLTAAGYDLAGKARLGVG